MRINYEKMADDEAEYGDGRWTGALIHAAGLTAKEAVAVRHCDFHFTREKVLITTATRITVLEPEAETLAFEIIDDTSLDYLVWPELPRTAEFMPVLEYAVQEVCQ